MATLYSEEEIQTRVKALAKEITWEICHQNGKQPPIFICVLNGAFMFFTDLVKHVPVDIEIDFVKVKSYTGHSRSEIEIRKDIEKDILNRDVFIVDDILDSGHTMLGLMSHLKQYSPKSITPVTLFRRSTTPETIKGTYVYHSIVLTTEVFLHGYGLDGKNGLYRNLPYIMGEEMEIE